MRYTPGMRLPTVSRREALVALAAAAVAPAALAELPPPPPGSARYHVEIVVFRQPGAPPPPLPAEPLTAGVTIPGRVFALTDSDWQLAGAATSLARRGYPVLAHAAWFAVVPPNGRTTAHLEELLPPDSAITGSVAVQRGQYLYLGVELDYRPAGNPQAGAAEVVYSLREKRRVKYGERHYFDHSAFGAIVTIGNPHA